MSFYKQVEKMLEDIETLKDSDRRLYIKTAHNKKYGCRNGNRFTYVCKSKLRNTESKRVCQFVSKEKG